MAATITVLVDDRARDDALASEHGLSLWIESGGVHVLFDTGQSAAFAENARRLGVPLGSTDHIVLSHGHYDHGGGLSVACEAAPRAAIHLHPEAVQTRFSAQDPRRPHAVGLPTTALRALEDQAARVRWTRRPTLLAPGLGLTGPIPRITDFEDTGGPFFLDAAGGTPDQLVDDQALWIDTREGVVAVLGCGHAGLVNTVRCVRDSLCPRRLHAVLGGFHLLGASQRRLDATVAALRGWQPDQLAPAHCTGERATAVLREAFPSAWRPVFSGTTLELGSPAPS